ncbi:hypothetical protein CONPUDRAFT_166074 [Coniophora puteana RWD-64-598 SS2]|uniref:Actin-like ATPase domain-containing protein n=1 Tax=Coniophora puteana (strain RWD-64-598) TaxID=741705 RepID=A0A5M3MN96_CONPW|nr:uncharacterized protein CONPUDRAFT_166074 [Coniophora puteana RWD-64-598 SS2]EIW80583.1 hypothetical protein CONPUDRAFT_166074 [Coniophora puteana RWD-64-598 SS2]
MVDRETYQGFSRKLVLAFDVGTTFSGVSYCVLDPGEVPHIQRVSRYPAQEHVGGDSKIPSILYYDRNQQVRAMGAEARQESIVEQAEMEGWTKLEWWKMHLRSKHLSAAHIKDSDIPPLPTGVSALQVLADFMGYLYHCAKTYIIESHANGPSLFASFGDSIEYVLSHPNGWEGVQQKQIRRAAVMAGLVPDEGREAQERIRLVTEGEASLHYCVANVLASDTWSRLPIEKLELDSGSLEAEEAEKGGVIVVDAGGGTIDLSAYYMHSGTATGKAISFEEIAPTECRLQGSVWVTRRGHDFLEKKLEGSRFAEQDYINQMTEVFDTSTKLRFTSPDDSCYIKFGTMRDKEPSYDVRGGQLRLHGKDIATLFEPSIQSVVDAVERQKAASQITISHVFLVGGFAASDYLFKQLQARLSRLGMSLCRPDSHTNKAVADGAISFYIDHLVATRAARFFYGKSANVLYNKRDHEHRLRRHKKYTSLDGTNVLPDCFWIILSKGTRVSEVKEFSQSFVRERVRKESLYQIDVDLIVYRGMSTRPTWIDDEESEYTELCTVYADTSSIAKNLRKKKNGGFTFYQLEFDIILLFGLTELQAQVRWLEKGFEKRSPATIVYNDEI